MKCFLIVKKQEGGDLIFLLSSISSNILTRFGSGLARGRWNLIPTSIDLFGEEEKKIQHGDRYICMCMNIETFLPTTVNTSIYTFSLKLICLTSDLLTPVLQPCRLNREKTAVSRRVWTERAFLRGADICFLFACFGVKKNTKR